LTPEQAELLQKAEDSLRAARLLANEGLHDFAASRAYYTMFYMAEALLLGDGLVFSKHSAVNAAFGREFVKTGWVPAHLHQYLIKAMEARHTGDYGPAHVDEAEVVVHIDRAEEFLKVVEALLGP
jgi:uncharacterized protein (UPF0332 family)